MVLMVRDVEGTELIRSLQEAERESVAPVHVKAASRQDRHEPAINKRWI